MLKGKVSTKKPQRRGLKAPHENGGGRREIRPSKKGAREGTKENEKREGKRPENRWLENRRGKRK